MMWEVFNVASGDTVFKTKFKWIAWLVCFCDSNWDWDREEEWSDEVWELPTTWDEPKSSN